jgi:NAD(P)-dependent dehydrogenase (short-subunit alcohol dehydrogenase family)
VRSATDRPFRSRRRRCLNGHAARRQDCRDLWSRGRHRRRRGPSLAREGARLFLTGRDGAKVDGVAEEIVAAGGVAEAARVDALDEDAVEEHLTAVVESAGGVDISFNAIGPGPAPHRMPLTELAADAFARPIAFYATSNFITATAAARRMSGRGSGVILTLTAVPGRSPTSRVGGSAPAWAAVEAFSRSLALETGPAGVRVVCLRSHAIPETPLIAENFATAGPAAGVSPAQFQAMLEQGTLLKRLPTLAEVADTAAFIASDRAGAMTATVVNLSAGSIAD